MKSSGITPDLLQDYVANQLDGNAHEHVARALGHDRAAARRVAALCDTLAVLRHCVPTANGEIPAEWIAILERRH